jgi:hypothetical protein
MTPPPRPPLVPGGPRLVLDLVESGVTAAKEPIPGWREVILTLIDELRESRAQLAEHEAAWERLTGDEAVRAADRLIELDPTREQVGGAIAAARTAARRRGP